MGSVQPFQTETQEVCVGIDVGGTFTDVVVADGHAIWRAKAPTTSPDIATGVLRGLKLVAEKAEDDLPQMLSRVTRAGLGTTAITNAITELVGAKVGLITTLGFEDELLLSRGTRFSVDGPIIGPPQLVGRRAIVGVRERVDQSGQVLEAIDLNEVARIAEDLVSRESVESFAVSFLHACRNPAHEEAAVHAVQSALPGMPIVSGTSLSPSFGFLQRTAFAVMNAFATDAFSGIEGLSGTLRGLGLAVPLRLVNSIGGTIGFDGARRVPMLLMHSGPAAGVAAAAAAADQSGYERVITCDMGGTSFDVSIVNHGVPLRQVSTEILRVPTSLSAVDVQSIGSGGGSIGWVDSRGMLRVGPKSAGSDPGPACYGRGGTEPTVTDALVVLGYIDAGRFLGGSMQLEVEAAAGACARLGRQLNLTVAEVAWGIRELSLAEMTRTVKLILNRRGLDPARHAIVSYGGCAGLFTADIARVIGVRNVIVPEVASVLSAFGAATAPIRRERASAMMVTFPFDSKTFASTVRNLREDVAKDLDEDGVRRGEQVITFEAAMRFSRQNFELPISVRTQGELKEALAHLRDDFISEYRRRYGEGSILTGTAIELVTLRAIGVGAPGAASMRSGNSESAGANGRSRERRQVYVDYAAEPTPVEIYRPADLAGREPSPGPACVDNLDTTIWVPRGASVRVDEWGSLVISTAEVRDMEGVQS